VAAKRTKKIILTELQEATERLVEITTEPNDFSSADEEICHLFDYTQRLGRARDKRTGLHNELATMFAEGCIFVFILRDHYGPEAVHISSGYPSYAKGMKFQIVGDNKLEIANDNITCTYPIKSSDCIIRGPRGVFVFFFRNPDIEVMRRLLSRKAESLPR